MPRVSGPTVTVPAFCASGARVRSSGWRALLLVMGIFNTQIFSFSLKGHHSTQMPDHTSLRSRRRAGAASSAGRLGTEESRSSGPGQRQAVRLRGWLVVAALHKPQSRRPLRREQVLPRIPAGINTRFSISASFLSYILLTLKPTRYVYLTELRRTAHTTHNRRQTGSDRQDKTQNSIRPHLFLASPSLKTLLRDHPIRMRASVSAPRVVTVACQ